MRERPAVTAVHVHQFRYGPKGQRGPVRLPSLLIEDQVWRHPSLVLGEGMANRAVLKGPLWDVCGECTAARKKHWGKIDDKGARHMLEVCKRVESKGELKVQRGCGPDGLEQKTMFRTGRGCVGWIHYAEKGTCTGNDTWADPNHLRGQLTSSRAANLVCATIRLPISQHCPSLPSKKKCTWTIMRCVPLDRQTGLPLRSSAAQEPSAGCRAPGAVRRVPS